MLKANLILNHERCSDMASITDRGNGTFLVRVYNGVKNGKPQSVAVTFKANAGSGKKGS